MKFLSVASLLMITAGAFAMEDLNSMKSAANSKIDTQLSALNKSKSCVNNATTVDAFKACNVEGTKIQSQEETIKTKTEKKTFSDDVEEGYEDSKEKLDDAM